MFKQASLKTRVTLFTLAAFLLGIWALFICARLTLRDDMQQLIGEQQLAHVTSIARSVESELTDRLVALDLSARRLGQAMAHGPDAVQADIASRELLQSLFNGGLFVTGPDGTAIADFPHTADRIGTHYMDRTSVSVPLQEGIAFIGRPALGKTLKAPVFSLSVPIRDARHKPVGVLVGTINLGKPNFLDHLMDGNYSLKGSYLLAAPAHNLYVTSSDKARTMQPLPQTGSSELFDQFAHGRDGHGVVVNERGEEMLVAAKWIPSAGWYMAIEFPAAEVFAPVERLQSRLLQATVLLSLLLGALTWWMLKHQLSPMLDAIDTLSTLRTGTQPIQALPVSQPDEIGNLIDCFNSLLVTLTEREQALANSEAFKLAVLNSMTTEICVLNADGIIVAANATWQQFGTDNGYTTHPSCAQGIGVGINYLSACSQQSGAGDVGLRIQAVLSGQSPGFELEYPCHGPDTQRWFSMAVTPLHVSDGGVVITHTDITERKRTENKLRIAATAFDSENAVLVTDAQSIILQVNRAFTRFTGYIPSEVLGRTPKLLQSGHHEAAYYHRLWATINANGKWQGEVWDKSKTGDLVPFWLSISAVKDAEGGITNYVGTLYDISERKNAEAALITLNAELTHSRQRLRELAAQTEGLREDERKHIAREVHDELGQLLTALRMDIAMLVPLFGDHYPALAYKAQGMKALVDKTIQGVRNVAMNLRPAVLDLGLMPALEWLCDEFSQRSHLVCTLDHDDADLVLDEARTMVVFRIAQESLTNVSRYARATRVSISCRQQGDQLHMEVRDNGQGFDMAAATRKQTFGLLGMQERALALKGRVEVASTPGRGTVVSVSIPLYADQMKEGAP